MQELLVDMMVARRDNMCDSGDTILLLGPVDPPGELNVGVGCHLSNLGRADICRGYEERKAFTCS